MNTFVQFLHDIHLFPGLLGALVGGLIGSLFPIPFFRTSRPKAHRNTPQKTAAGTEDHEIIVLRKQMHELASKRFPELTRR